MQETDRINQAESIDSPMKINIPHYGIDLRVILLGLRYELATQELYFAPKKQFPLDNVIVPTLRIRFNTYPKNGFLVVHYWKDVKIPIKMDGELISIETMDILVDYLEKKQVNYPARLPSPTHEHNVRLRISRREFPEP